MREDKSIYVHSMGGSLDYHQQPGLDGSLYPGPVRNTGHVLTDHALDGSYTQLQRYLLLGGERGRMDQTPLSEDSGKVSKRRGFGHTLAPSNLWFYLCNNCNLILPLAKLRLRYSARGSGNGGNLEMLLCSSCLREYNVWNNRWSGFGNVQRG